MYGLNHALPPAHIYKEKSDLFQKNNRVWYYQQLSFLAHLDKVQEELLHYPWSLSY